MFEDPKAIRDEAAAKQKLIREINGIEEEKNQVGRYVLGMFGFVFFLAVILLGVVLLNPQER
jgi:hypothetical protein